MSAACKHCPKEPCNMPDDEAYRFVPRDEGTEARVIIPCRACRHQPKKEIPNA
jgi:hypothetical protein